MSRPLLVLALLAPTFVHAQFRLWASAGFGMYSMNDLKEIQKGIGSSFPIQGQITDQFPGTTYYEAGFIKDSEDRKPFYGLALLYMSTGGRVQYTDYSGSLTSDQLVSCIGFSIPFGLILNPESTFKLRLDLRPGILLNSLEVTYEASIGSQTQNDATRFRSVNFFFQPTLNVERNLGSFTAFAGLGYHFSIVSGKVILEGNDNAYLLTPDGKQAGLNWSGVRVAVGIGYRID